MTDRLKNRIRFSTTLDKKTIQTLKEYSDKTMIPISKIVDAAIQEYIKKRGWVNLNPSFILLAYEVLS